MRRCNQGFSLIEMMVSLVILGILASITLPYVQVSVTRAKELELRQDLRDVRRAIDQFHDDWKNEVIERTDPGCSTDGYPKTLQVLVDGVQRKGGDSKKRYLRRIPRNPFADKDGLASDDWKLRSYQDDPDTEVWGGQDVYDIRPNTDKQALNGTYYRDW